VALGFTPRRFIAKFPMTGFNNKQNFKILAWRGENSEAIKK
jgi:hypothetical protein